MSVAFCNIQLIQLEQYFNRRMLPLEYNQSMKTALLLIAMLALSLAQTASLSNCFIANLNTSLCIKCNDGFQLSQAGTCNKCLQGYQLVNNICTLATITTATTATSTTSAAQTTASTTNINANINEIISNPTLLAALMAYIQGLNSGTNSLVVTNPCATIVNNVCTSCSPNYTLVNGVCTSSTTPTTTTTPSSSSSSAATTLPGLTTTTSSNAPSSAAQTSTPSTSTTASSNVVFLPFYTSVTTSNPVSPSESSPSTNYTDSNCKTIDTSLSICSECYSGYYYNSFSKSCIATNPLCQNVTKTNLCLSCYQGYVLYFGNCVKALSNCRSISANNTCTACFDGYELVNATCQLKNETASSQIDQCSNFSNGSCVTCVTRYYLSSSGKCMQVDPNCQNYTDKGVCQLCYKGFKYLNGICMKYDFNNFWFNIPSSNPIQCVFRSVNINGVCVRVNDQCATWSSTTALCTGCYRGYDVVNGACVAIAG